MNTPIINDTSVQNPNAALPPHVQRMIGEHANHLRLTAALKLFVETNPLFATLDVAEQADQRKQLDGMTLYLEALGSRLRRAGVVA